MSTTLLALAAVLLTLGYLLVCRVWPYAACLRCGGDGKLRSPSGRTWRRCRRCGGSGERLRIGRRVINHFRETHHHGTR